MNKLKELKNYDQKQLFSALSKGAINGEIELVKTILINFDTRINSVQHAFYNACTKNQLPIMDFLLYSNELKYNADIKGENNIAFSAACEGGIEAVKFLMPILDYESDIIVKAISRACSHGKLETVQYLLAEREKREGSHIGEEINIWLERAGSNGKIDIFDYLLNLSFDKDILFNTKYGRETLFEEIIMNCIGNEELDTVKYFFNHEKLKDNMTVNKCKNYIFKYFCEDENQAIINFCVFDLMIEKNEDISKFLEELAYTHINSLFEKRELNQNLNMELDPNNKKIKQSKI